jgi:hypothetical protein
LRAETAFAIREPQALRAGWCGSAWGPGGHPGRKTKNAHPAISETPGCRDIPRRIEINVTLTGRALARPALTIN